MRATSILAVVLALATADLESRADDLRVGRASVDITPPPGTPMLTPQRPPFEVMLAEVAHDPLRVKAIVLDQGGRTAALIVCDLTSIPIDIIAEARKQAGASTGIDPDSIMISATHCHTAPQIRMRFLGRADEPSRERARSYIDALPGRIAEAVRLAEADLRPARPLAAVGREGSVSFNRRFYMNDGTVLTNPGKADASLLREVDRPTGPIDPEVGVVRFEAEDGTPLATLVNFALHLDTMGGSRPSADFPFMIDRILGDVLGPDALTVFAIGAAGNINHYDLLDPDHPRRSKGPSESSRIGAILAAEVLRTQPRLVPFGTAPPRTAREVVRLEMPVDKGRALAERSGNASRIFDGELMVTNEGGRQTFEAEVQAIALGDELAWVGLPGEMFVELGLALKDASPFRHTMIHTLANGSIGYVPNLRAYPEGAYEADSSRCAPGSGERLIEAATRLLVRLKAEGRPPSPSLSATAP